MKICSHIYEEIEDYVSRVFPFLWKTRIKILRCKHCGKQIEERFAIKGDLK